MLKPFLSRISSLITRTMPPALWKAGQHKRHGLTQLTTAVLTLLLLGLITLLYQYGNIFFNKVKPAEPKQIFSEKPMPPDASMRVRVQVNTSGTKLDLYAIQGNAMTITGNVDVANYSFSHESYPSGDNWVCKFSIRPKSIGLSDGIENSTLAANSILIGIPINYILDLDLNFEHGVLEMDLGALSISNLELRSKNADLGLSCSDPNPLEMTMFKYEGIAGSLMLNDLQNYRFHKGQFLGENGQMRLSNSGDFFFSETLLRMDMSFGSARLELPSNAVTSNSVLQEASSRKIQKGKTLVRLEGGATSGEHIITYETRKPNLDGLIRKLMRQNVSSEQLFLALRSTYQKTPNAYNFDEISLNQVGYFFLQRNQIDAAIAVFKINIEIHPDYANGYDSLAEGYMVGGYREQAILFYEKSVELNPQNHTGKEMLNRLKNEDPVMSLTPAPLQQY